MSPRLMLGRLAGGRSPGAGAGLGSQIRVRRLLAVLLLLAAVPVLLAWALTDLSEPERLLADRPLVGSRGPSCLRLVIANDVSGSMSDFAGARDAALHQLVDWAPRNLRPDDELSIVDFAADAAVRLPVSPVRTIGPAAASPAVVHDGSETLLAPVLTASTPRVRGTATSP